MLNQKIRYSIIKPYIKETKHSKMQICEVGSGNFGLGRFYSDTIFTGVDVRFDDYSNMVRSFPKKMKPITADVTKHLPFSNNKFHLVLSLDTIEHIRRSQRERSIKEIVRIGGNTIIIGFPCGKYSRMIDSAQYYLLRFLNRPIPAWLSEHLKIEYPDEEEMNNILNKQDIKYDTYWNESIILHCLIQLFEMITFGSSYFDRLFPIGLAESVGKIGMVFYRKIYVINKV